MRKIALYMEVPTAHLDDLHPLIDGHFCIASTCLKDAGYFQWYKDFSRNHPRDCNLILDNGAHEEGTPVSNTTLFNIAQEIQPNMVFAPDILEDRKETLALGKEFIALHKEYEPNWKIGLVPQGEDDEDLHRCYEEMFMLHRANPHIVSCIGLSLMDNRANLINTILNHHGSLAPVDHHMLGLRNLEEIPLWPKQIVAMDTVKPFKAAHFDKKIEEDCRGLGKWNSKWKFEDSQERYLCYRNICVLHKHLSREE